MAMTIPAAAVEAALAAFFETKHGVLPMWNPVMAKAIAAALGAMGVGELMEEAADAISSPHGVVHPAYADDPIIRLAARLREMATTFKDNA